MSEQNEFTRLADAPGWQKFLWSTEHYANQGVEELPLAIFIHLETHHFGCYLKMRFIWRGRTFVSNSGSMRLPIQGTPLTDEFQFILHLREQGYSETKLWEWKSEDGSKTRTLVLFFQPEHMMDWYPND